MAKRLTKRKAAEILSDGSVRGEPITDKQRRYFGAVATGVNTRVKRRRRRPDDHLGSTRE